MMGLPYGSTLSWQRAHSNFTTSSAPRLGSGGAFGSTAFAVTACAAAPELVEAEVAEEGVLEGSADAEA